VDNYIQGDIVFVRDKAQKRTFIGTTTEEVVSMPNLIDIQLSSYEKFLQLDRVKKGEPLSFAASRAYLKQFFQLKAPMANWYLILIFINLILME
jgi:DNA-directed RNA polymerase subunit beta